MVDVAGGIVQVSGIETGSVCKVKGSEDEAIALLRAERNAPRSI